MSGGTEFQEQGEVQEQPKEVSEETKRLDQATTDPEAAVERQGDYQQAEQVENAFKEVVQAAETGDGGREGAADAATGDGGPETAEAGDGGQQGAEESRDGVSNQVSGAADQITGKASAIQEVVDELENQGQELVEMAEGLEDSRSEDSEPVTEDRDGTVGDSAADQDQTYESRSDGQTAARTIVEHLESAEASQEYTPDSEESTIKQDSQEIIAPAEVERGETTEVQRGDELEEIAAPTLGDEYDAEEISPDVTKAIGEGASSPTSGLPVDDDLEEGSQDAAPAGTDRGTETASEENDLGGAAYKVTLEGAPEAGRMTVEAPTTGTETVMIDTVPLPESPAEEVISPPQDDGSQESIGTLPTPDSPESMLDSNDEIAREVDQPIQDLGNQEIVQELMDELPKDAAAFSDQAAAEIVDRALADAGADFVTPLRGAIRDQYQDLSATQADGLLAASLLKAAESLNTGEMPDQPPDPGVETGINPSYPGTDPSGSGDPGLEPPPTGDDRSGLNDPPSPDDLEDREAKQAAYDEYWNQVAGQLLPDLLDVNAPAQLMQMIVNIVKNLQDEANALIENKK